jgi:hypothetical protein
MVGRCHPATIAKLHAGLIIQSALDAGWKAPAHYSPLKRARIARRLQLLAQSLHRQPNARPVRTDGPPRDSGTHEAVVR